MSVIACLIRTDDEYLILRQDGKGYVAKGKDLRNFMYQIVSPVCQFEWTDGDKSIIQVSREWGQLIAYISDNQIYVADESLFHNVKLNKLN